LPADDCPLIQSKGDHDGLNRTAMGQQGHHKDDQILARPQSMESRTLLDIPPIVATGLGRPSRPSSTDAQRGHLAEMEAVDGQRNGQREQSRAPEQGPEKELPIMHALDATDAQLVN